MTAAELHIYLDDLGIPRTSRGAVLVEKIGYTSSAISRILSGKSPVSDKFLDVLKQRLCPMYVPSAAEIRKQTAIEAYRIVEEWQNNPKLLDVIMHRFDIYFDIYPKNQEQP